MHLFTPLDMFKGVFSPLKTTNSFHTDDPPERARAVVAIIEPTDALIFGGAPPFVNISKLGPGRFRAEAPIMTLEMHLTVVPDGKGSLIEEHIAIKALVPGAAAFADTVHSLATSLARGYQQARRRAR